MLPTSIPQLSSRRQVLGAGFMAALGSWAGLELLGAHVAGATPIATTGRIAVVGDSLTIGTLRYQADAFSTVGWARSTIDAHGSRGVRTKVKSDPHTGLTAVDAIRAESGDSDVWVVALGTNDAGMYSKDKSEEVIHEMLDRIGPGHVVLWVNIYRPEIGPRQLAWNSALTVAAEERPRQMFVFDWATLATQNKRWLAGDLVHCTGKGYQHRATAIAQASRMIVPAVASSSPRQRELWLRAPAG